MATLKEQAKVAAYSKAVETQNWADPLVVDAASEVWEPVVLSLTKVIDAMLATGAFTSAHKQILDEAKAGLGK